MIVYISHSSLIKGALCSTVSDTASRPLLDGVEYHQILPQICACAIACFLLRLERYNLFA